MIRYLSNLLIFLLGLAGAALWFGEMRHLRQAAGPLPLWTSFINDDARIFDGGASVTLPGLPSVAAAWQGRAPGGDGLHWDTRLSGDGLEAVADVTLHWWPDRVILQEGQGTVSLEALTNGQATGLYRIDDLRGEVRLWDRPEGFIEIQLDQATPLPPEAAAALSQISRIEGNLIRLTLPLP